MPWPAATRASSAVSIGVSGGRIVGRDEPPPERLAEPALVVVAGLDADRRRVEPDEQQPVAQRRQVGQRRDGVAVRSTVVRCGPGPGAVGQRRQLVRGQAGGACCPAVGRRRRPLPGLDLGLGLGGLGLRVLDALPSAAPDFGRVLGPRHDDDETRMMIRMSRMSVACADGTPQRPRQRHRDHEAERGVGRRERGDLVVDEPGLPRRLDDLDVPQGRRLALARDDPDRAVRPDACPARSRAASAARSSRRRAGRRRCRAPASPR